MALTPQDRTTITDLISMHGHLVDDGQLDRLHEIFTEDVVYDVTNPGAPKIEGLSALGDAAIALGDGNPVGHHVTNIVLTERADGKVSARSKGIGVMRDGTCGSATYEDTVLRPAAGWRITHRRIIARREPLGGSTNRD